VKDTEDSILVKAAVDGDIDGFTALCQRYYQPMVSIAQSYLYDRHCAEDAAQQALAKAYFNLSKLKKANQFSKWLMAICRNEAKDMAKKRSKQELKSIDDIGLMSKSRRNSDRYVEIVQNVIETLPHKSRELIYLRYYDQLSYQKISRILGISQQAVNGRLRRIKKVIAKKLFRYTSVEIKF